MRCLPHLLRYRWLAVSGATFDHFLPKKGPVVGGRPQAAAGGSSPRLATGTRGTSGSGGKPRDITRFTKHFIKCCFAVNTSRVFLRPLSHSSFLVQRRTSGSAHMARRHTFLRQVPDRTSGHSTGDDRGGGPGLHAGDCLQHVERSGMGLLRWGVHCGNARRVFASRRMATGVPFAAVCHDPLQTPQKLQNRRTRRGRSGEGLMNHGPMPLPHPVPLPTFVVLPRRVPLPLPLSMSVTVPACPCPCLWRCPG